MPDLDELFRTSIELETSPSYEPDAAQAPTVAEDRSQPAEVDDDLLVDVRALVTQWNAEHAAPPADAGRDAEPPVGEARHDADGVQRHDADGVQRHDADGVQRHDVDGVQRHDADGAVTDAGRRSRLDTARTVLAERIGSHPGNPIEVPHPEGASDVADAADVADDAADDEVDVADDAIDAEQVSEVVEALEARHAAVEPVLDLTVLTDAALADVPSTSRERRRSQREVDRLQRECARRPLELPDESEVTVIGRAHASPADLQSAPATAPAPVVRADEPEQPRPASRRARHRGWRSAEKQRRRDARHQVRFPILTRSVSLWLFIFMVAGLVFGASAAFWWSQFNAEVDEIRAETSEFTDEVAGAASALESQRIAALNEIDASMEPLARLAQPGRAPAMAAEAAESVFFVETLDEAGAASVGSAFVVANTDTQSLLLTSLTSVASSTISPGPAITLRQGDRELAAELWSWDVDLDLALLLVDDPELPALEWAGDDAASEAVGSGVFAVGGLGGAGATAIPGLVVDQSASGFQHTAVIGSAYRGGPILTNDGMVLGIASLDYQPLGFDPGDVHFSVPVTGACGTVLACGAGGPTDAGAEGGDPILDPEAAPEATPEADAT